LKNINEISIHKGGRRKRKENIGKTNNNIHHEWRKERRWKKKRWKNNKKGNLTCVPIFILTLELYLVLMENFLTLIIKYYIVNVNPNVYYKF